jgi:hypothetical protein
MAAVQLHDSAATVVGPLKAAVTLVTRDSGGTAIRILWADD